MDIHEMFDLLECTRPSTVSEIKNLITENFNTTKDSWLVGGLWDYFILTNSTRCVEILSGISKEPHDKYLIEKISEGLRDLRGQTTKKQSLRLLGDLVRKQPSWLYKIVQYGLLKDLIKMLKTETDIVLLITGLLIVITLLPILPVYLVAYVTDVFDVFSRLATWTHTNNHDMPEEQLLHLQVALYSLFHRLYAMYPCNFLSYLRHNFSAHDKALVFHHTIKPMLETVKMHPLLITASMPSELSSHRWKSKEYHDVIAECSKLSIDVLESGICEEHSFRPTLSSIPPLPDPSVCPSFLSATLETLDLNNLLNNVEEVGTAPPTPITSTLTPPSADETAMEATPENTPLQTPVKDRERLVFKLPDRASNAAVHLNFGERKSIHSITPLHILNTTPVNSVPSSPLPQMEPLTRRESVPGDLSLIRRDSLLFQRLQKVMVEQQQQQQQHQQGEQPKNLLINIPSQADQTDLFQEHGGPLTPILQTQTSEVDEDAPCQENGPCRGGLHMPDTKSLIDFATRVKRLRFYSQGEETAGKTKVKRSLSCPDIKEEVSEEVEQPPQEVSRPIYEHLFEGIVDVWGDKNREGEHSPHTLLDECVKKAASLHGNGGAHEARLKAEVELLHNQLLFERHRREAHTLRNRRLANKARRAQISEEQIFTLKSQLHQSEKEIASLKKEMSRQRSTAMAKETELQNMIKDLDGKLKAAKSTCEAIEEEKMDVTEKYRQLTDDYSLIKKEADEKSAVIYSLESEVKHCKNYVIMNGELQDAYQASQKDIIMLGELCRRQEEALSSMKPNQYIEDITDVKMSYEEEIRSLMNALETKSSQLEAFSGFIQDQEAALAKKDKIIEDLKKLVQDTGAEHSSRYQAYSEKYHAVKSINHRLELEILNLNAKNERVMKTENKTNIVPSMETFSPTSVSPTSSDVTVDSATSTGGILIFGSPQ